MIHVNKVTSIQKKVETEGQLDADIKTPIIKNSNGESCTVTSIPKKTKTEVEVNEDIRIPTTENQGGESYKVTDVIVHTGTEAINGHHVATHYEDHKGWEKIDDEKCVLISRKEAENLNKQGVIYVLRRKW